MAFGAYSEVRLVMREIATGNEAGVKLFYKQGAGTPPSPLTIVDFANSFFNEFSGVIVPLLIDDVAFQRVELVYRDGTSAFVDGISTDPAEVGTIASTDMFPEQNAVVIQRRTGLPGRNKRGRIFWPFVPESFAAGSTIVPVAMALYLALAVKMSDLIPAGPDAENHLPHTPDYKTNNLVPVVNCRVLSEIASRDDRKFQKRGFPVGA